MHSKKYANGLRYVVFDMPDFKLVSFPHNPQRYVASTHGLAYHTIEMKPPRTIWVNTSLNVRQKQKQIQIKTLYFMGYMLPSVPACNPICHMYARTNGSNLEWIQYRIDIQSKEKYTYVNLNATVKKGGGLSWWWVE